MLLNVGGEMPATSRTCRIGKAVAQSEDTSACARMTSKLRAVVEGVHLQRDLEHSTEDAIMTRPERLIL